MGLSSRRAHARHTFITAFVGLGALTLAACSGGGGQGSTDASEDAGDGGGAGAAEAGCTNTVVNPDAEQVSVWAWYPSFEMVVDNFNETHDDVQMHEPTLLVLGDLDVGDTRERAEPRLRHAH